MNAKNDKSEKTPIAAIDAGSNGIRLAMGEVDQTGQLYETRRIRKAVRLGQDAFAQGWLGSVTINTAVDTFREFREILDKHDIQHLRAVATSATREASNGDELVKAVHDATGIQLEIIDGLEEAQIGFAAMAGQIDLKGKTSVTLDLGGGSLEITVARNGRAMGCETLPLGPVRLLTELKKNVMLEADAEHLVARYSGTVAALLRAELEGSADVCIGTGGNVERMGKLRVQLLGKEGGRTDRLRADELEQITEKILAIPVTDRIKNLGLRPDRADVIAIACIVMRQVLLDAGIEKLTIPRVGLKEGLLRQLAIRVHAPDRPMPIVFMPAVSL